MKIQIEGMGCMHCVAKVKKAMEDIGATVINCEVGSCEIEPYADTDRIRDAIEGVGFEVISID